MSKLESSSGLNRTLVPNTGRGLWSATNFAAFSTATWQLCTTDRRKEWYDILVDYCHHKRCRFLPNVWDNTLFPIIYKALRFEPRWSSNGINPASIQTYLSSFTYNTQDKQFVFRCFDGRRSIPIHAINDNYCDCLDGSDEPGTSACAGTGNSGIRFWCENNKHESMEIPRWRVNDGICDCCDGSDELVQHQSESLHRNSPCPNTCAELGKARQREITRQKNVTEKGQIIWKTLIKKGETIKELWEKNKRQLETIDIPSLTKQITELTNYLSHLKGKKKKEGAIEDVGKHNMTSEPPSSETNDENEEKQESVSLDELDSPNLQSHEKQVLEENEELLSAEKEPLRVSEYVQWMDSDHSNRQDDDNDAAGDFAAPSVSENSLKDTQKEDVLNKDTLPEFGNNMVNNLTWFSAFTFRALNFVKQLTKYFGNTDSLDKVSSKLEKMELDLEEKKKKLTEILSQLTASNEVKRLIQCHSLNNIADIPLEFIPLMKECFKKNIDKYKYEICLFNNATQSEESVSPTILGTFSKLKHISHNEYIMEFINGDKCWNGPVRSLTVLIRCGVATEVQSISETERCVYVAIMTSPAACIIPNFNEISNQQLAQKVEL